MLQRTVMADAGYWIALARVGDALHPVATAWQALMDRRGTRILTTDWFLVETLRVLGGPPLRTTRATALGVVDAIRKDRGVAVLHVGPEIRDAAWHALRSQPARRWSWADAAAFELMRAHGVTQALAHDKHFIEAGFDALLRSDPAAYA